MADIVRTKGKEPKVLEDWGPSNVKVRSLSRVVRREVESSEEELSEEESSEEKVESSEEESLEEKSSRMKRSCLKSIE